MECDSDGWGDHNCDHGEDQSLVCKDLHGMYIVYYILFALRLTILSSTNSQCTYLKESMVLLHHCLLDTYHDDHS